MTVLSATILLQGCAGTSKRVPPPPKFSNAEIEAAYKNGEKAIVNGDYVRARRVLMQIISNYPGENDLAQVQWLIARTYQLEGQPDQAISEFKRFLANFPDHPNAPDAEDRIHDLERAVPRKSKQTVHVIGTWSTDYEYGKDLSPEPLPYLNRITTRLDAQVRDLDDGRGKLVFSGLRSFDLDDSHDDQARLQKLYGDWHNAVDTFSVRAGRQPSTPGSLSTRYDGAEVHYRLIPTVALHAAAGFPVDLSTSGSITTDTRFYEAGVSLLDLAGTTGRVYAMQQTAGGVVDRQAVGGNVQGVWGRVGLNGNVDYDTSFGEFNDRFLSLDYQLMESLHVAIAHDIRKDPYLQMSTALQDPQVLNLGIGSVSEFVSLLGEDAVRNLADTYTIDSTDTRVGFRWSISTHWTSSLDYAYTTSQIGQPGQSRTERTYNRVSAYLAQYDAWKVPDSTSVLIVYQDGDDLTTDTLSLIAGQRLTPSTTLQLKARFESTNFKDGATGDSTRYIPGLVLTVLPASFLSVTAEGEYTMENLSDAPGRTSIFSRLNVTLLF